MGKITIEPKYFRLSVEGTVQAIVELYSTYDYPTILPEKRENVDEWWYIASSFSQSIEMDQWNTLSKTRQNDKIEHTHKKMFPAWTADVNRKRISLPPKEKLLPELEDIILNCHSHITTAPITYRIFPRRAVGFNAVNGFTSVGVRTNAINVFVDGTGSWKTDLRETVSHEYIHMAYYRKTDVKSTLSTRIVEEGLALHFSDRLYSTKSPSVNKPISYKETARLLKKHEYWLRRKLSAKTEKELYYADDIIYDIGYRVVGLFLETLPGLDWNAVLQNTPDEIMQVARWALDKKLK